MATIQRNTVGHRVCVDQSVTRKYLITALCNTLVILAPTSAATIMLSTELANNIIHSGWQVLTLTSLDWLSSFGPLNNVTLRWFQHRRVASWFFLAEWLQPDYGSVILLLIKESRSKNRSSLLGLGLGLDLVSYLCNFMCQVSCEEMTSIQTKNIQIVQKNLNPVFQFKESCSGKNHNPPKTDN